MTAPMNTPPDNRPENRPVYLVFEFERRAYPVGDEVFTIGRSTSCDIVVREPAVSRVHAEVTRSADGVSLKPFGSTPTIVNGLPVPGEAILHHGDQIEIGSAKLTFTEFSLPLGVSIVDKGRRKLTPEDIANRRVTITNPIMAGRANPNDGPARKLFKPAVIVGIVAAVIAYYFGVMLR